MRRSIVVVLVALAACGGAQGRPLQPTAPPAGSTGILSITSSTGTHILHVTVARTDAERQHGLMGVTSLPRNAGEAFVWSAPTTTTFWMKDTLIPLSIAFWGADGRIVGLTEMTPCRSDPCRVYGSPRPYVGAVEANAGFFTDHGIGIGDRVTLRGTPSA